MFLIGNISISSPCQFYFVLYCFIDFPWSPLPLKFVRMALDILVVVTGVLFGGKFGVCTLITVIISGPIIQFVNAKAKQVLKI